MIVEEPDDGDGGKRSDRLEGRGPDRGGHRIEITVDEGLGEAPLAQEIAEAEARGIGRVQHGRGLAVEPHDLGEQAVVGGGEQVAALGEEPRGAAAAVLETGLRAGDGE